MELSSNSKVAALRPLTAKTFEDNREFPGQRRPAGNGRYIDGDLARLKLPMDYSVFSASSAAVLLALHAFRQHRENNSSEGNLMNRKWNRGLMLVAVGLIAFRSAGLYSQTTSDEELLRARESVWRAWFAGDSKTLEELVPPETMVVRGGDKEWKHQSDILRSSADFHSKSGKLIRPEFPQTEFSTTAM